MPAEPSEPSAGAHARPPAVLPTAVVHSLLLSIVVIVCCGAFVGCTPKGPAPAVTRPPGTDIDPLILEVVRKQIEVVESDPYDPSERGSLAMVYDANELYAAAAAEYAAAATLAPEDALWPYRTAVCRIQRGDTEGGRAELVAVTTRFPAFAPAWHRLALLRLGDGDLPGARDALERCLALDPNDPAAGATRGDLLLREGRAEDAVPVLESVTRTASSNRQARFLLGRAYQAIGREDAAVEILLGEGAGASPARVQDPRERAIDGFRSGLAEESDRAIGLLQSGRASEAIPRFERILAHFPDAGSILINLAQARDAVGDRAGALAALDRAEKVEPENFRVHLVRAFLEFAEAERRSRGRPAAPGVPAVEPDADAARESYRASLRAAQLAVRHGRDEWRALYTLGKAAVRLEMLPEARRALLDAKALQPHDPELNLWLFETCWRMKDRVNALAALDDAIEADPGNINAWVNLIHVSIETDDLERARTALERGRTIDAQHPRIVQAGQRLEAALRGAGEPERP